MAVYFIQAEGTDWVKIGFAIDPDKRRKMLQTGAAQSLKMLRVIDGDRTTESEAHRRFAEHRAGQGEWFKFHPDMLTAQFHARNTDKPASDDSRIHVEDLCNLINSNLSEIGRTLGISRAAVSQWKKNGIPAARAIELEKMFGGNVRAAELCISETKGRGPKPRRRSKKEAA